MPFTWNFIAEKGQIWGNRLYGNNVSVTNPYRFSYAGYNELLTGHVDNTIYSNKAKFNSNTNLLNYINSQPDYNRRLLYLHPGNCLPIYLVIHLMASR